MYGDSHMDLTLQPNEQQPKLSDYATEIVTSRIEDVGLHGTVVMAASVLHLDTLVQEIQAELSALRRLTLAQTEVLKAFSDLYLELTGESEHRKFLDRSIRKAEREAQRLRLPLWFWRPEPDLELKKQVYRRADFLLHEQRANVDDTFDLLREFVDDCARSEIPVTDKQLSGLIECAHRKKVN